MTEIIATKTGSQIHMIHETRARGPGRLSSACIVVAPVEIA